MESIKKYKNQLPLTFQKAKIKKIENFSEPLKENIVTVKNLNSDAVSAENFYKPISKMITIHGVE